MHNLLTSARRPDRRPGALLQTPGAPRNVPVGLRVNANHEAMLNELQGALDQNGITAEQGEIMQALVDALAVRPTLYRGLLAAYLLKP